VCRATQAFEHVAKHTKGVPAERVVEVISRLGASVGPVGLAGGQVTEVRYQERMKNDSVRGPTGPEARVPAAADCPGL
jgi:hypothetical protein